MTPSTYAGKLRDLARNNTVWVFLLVLIMVPALLLAVVNNMALTWDGAWYLFTMLNTGQPYIAHDRLIDAPLHMPVIWASQLSNGIRLPLLVFGMVHVITPAAAVLLSWWVVRKRAPALIVWPVLSIGLMMLPAHSNFIAETLKAYMLMWPLMLAVLVGLPPNTVALFAMIALAIVLLHPAAILVFLATAAAAFVVAYVRPAERSRLIQAAICLTIIAGLRYTMIVDSYESDGFNMVSIRAQWNSSATVHTTLAVGLAFGTGALLLVHGLINRWNLLFATGMVAMVATAGIALAIWARDLGEWYTALDFRGPNHIVTLVLAGMAFLDAVFAMKFHPTRLEDFKTVRRLVTLAIAVVFSVVISLQSLAFGSAVDDLKHQMQTPGEVCINTSSLQSYPESPLNHWSVAAHSLLYQGYKPNRIMVDRDRCDSLELNGTLFLSGSYLQTASNRYDLLPLAWSLNATDMCWVNARDPLTSTVSEPDVRLFVDSSTSVLVTLSVSTSDIPATVEITANGNVVKTVILSADVPSELVGFYVNTVPGQNVIRFLTSDNQVAGISDISASLPDGTVCLPRQ